MTSLAAQGFSLTALPLTDAVRSGLQAPVAAHTAWPAVRSVGPLEVRAMPEATGETFEPSVDAGARAVVVAVCEALVAAEDELNALDARVGDGDTGSTFATAARRVLDATDRLPLADPPALLRALSVVLTTAMGGSSGVLASILFSAAGGAAREGATTPDALWAGAESMQHHGGAAPGDRTLLDALVPALEALRAGSSLADAASAAEAGARSTADMGSAAAGRSAYVSGEHLAGVQDPGAAAVAVMLRAAAGA